MARNWPTAIAEANGEGGTIGATVTAIGGLSAVQISAPSTLVWVAGIDAGQPAMRATGAGAIAQGRIDSAKIGSRTETHFAGLFRYDTQPTGFTPLYDFKQTDGGLFSFRISRGATGLLRLVKSDVTTVATMPAGKEMPTGQWIRVDCYVNVTTSAYRLSWSLLDAATVSATIEGTSTPRTDAAPAFGASIAQVVAGRLATPDHTTDFGPFAIATAPLGARATAPVAAATPWVRGTNRRGFGAPTHTARRRTISG